MKFPPYTPYLYIRFNGPVDCRTGPYREAVFTARDDDTVGTVLPNSTGTPSGYYAYRALFVYGFAERELHHLVVKWAVNAIECWYTPGRFHDLQIVNCGTVLRRYYIRPAPVHNILLWNVGTAFAGYAVTYDIHHATVDGCTSLSYIPSSYQASYGTNNITNSILANVSGWGQYNAFQPNYNATYNTPALTQVVPINLTASPFVTVGGGAHYLANGSICRNAGAQDIPAVVSGSVGTLTTDPPGVYQDDPITSDLVLSPRAVRDAQIHKNLGYHYAPLDYAFGGVTVEANLTFAPGTAVGWFRTSSGWGQAGHGIHIGDQKILTFNGTVEAPAYWARCNTVQEGGTGLWDGGYGPGGITGWAEQLSDSPELRARFTRFSVLAGDGNHARDDNGYLIVRATDCEFYSGGLGGYLLSCHLTNCLFDRTYAGQVGGYPGNEFHLRNCTWHGAALYIYRWYPPIPVSVRDCAFDGTIIAVDGDGNTDYDYNAFLISGQRLTPPGAHDVLVGSFNWQTGPLGGRYYLPVDSPLVNVGSRTPAEAGLFHFTTRVDQQKDGLPKVDIGLHYLALNAQNGPFDTDGDGLADYEEDLNGDGQVGEGDTAFNDSDTDNDGMHDGWEAARGMNPIVDDAAGDIDGDDITNLEEYLGEMSQIRREPLPLGPSSRRTGLVISEIMYYPANGQENEFVELYNAHHLPYDLNGYQLRIGRGRVIQPVPAATPLAPGEYRAVGFNDQLDEEEDQVELLNPEGAVLLNLEYSSRWPWPVEAAGAGHSLVLAQPSYGEADPRAWGPSRNMEGSRGLAETIGLDDFDAIRINEFLANPPTGQSDFIELYNHSGVPVDISGAILTDQPTQMKFVIPNGTIVPPRGFLAFVRGSGSFGFNLDAAGDEIYLFYPDQTRVLDAVAFERQAEGVSSGRYPDGAPALHELAAQTPGAANNGLRLPDIVINEIMFNPISGDADEYIEFYNRSQTQTYVLNNWRVRGVGNFTFRDTPTLSLAPNSFLVVARNPASLFAKYPQLNDQNTFGWPDGAGLANGGEAIALVGNDNRVIDEVTYGDGGRWSQWADGGGASLELRNPCSDNRLAANWGDSSEPVHAEWTVIDQSGVLMDGDGTSPINALEIILLGAGECLVDYVRLIPEGSTDRFYGSGDFSTGVEGQYPSGWHPEGNHDLSGWTSREGGCLHLRATGRGDYLDNRVKSADWTPQLSPGTSVRIQARVLWLRGSQDIVFRLRGNYFEATERLALPPNLGTPGLQNSRYRGNSPPAIFDVTHQPVLPAAGQPVFVTARVHDADGIAFFSLLYRVDPGTSLWEATMRDDGRAGDALAGDGTYTATIPGQPANTLVAFQLVASDANGPSVRFPTERGIYPGDREQRECLIRVGETEPDGSFGTYRIWITDATFTRWSFPQRAQGHNGALDATFAYGAYRAIYNAGGWFAGSANSSLNFDTPLGALCGYNVAFPSDEVLLGADEASLDAQHPAGVGPYEQVGMWMASEMELPAAHRRFVHVFVNGVRRGSIYEDIQQPNADYIAEWFPDREDGDLFKLEVWWHAHYGSQAGGGRSDARLDNYTLPGGQKNLTRYRWNWQKRAVRGSGNDYQALFDLVDAVQEPNPDDYTTAITSRVEFEQWMRTFATERMLGNVDSYGYRIGHNIYAYKPSPGSLPDDLWHLMIYDIDYATTDCNPFGVCEDLYQNAEDPNIVRMMNHPPFLRAYLRAFQEAMSPGGPLNPADYDGFLAQPKSALEANDVAVAQANFDAIGDYLDARRTFLGNELSNWASPFEISNSGGDDYTTSSSSVVLSGRAPVEVRSIQVSGATVIGTMTWPAVTTWNVPLSLQAGANNITIQGKDRNGNDLAGYTDTIVITYQP